MMISEQEIRQSHIDRICILIGKLETQKGLMFSEIDETLEDAIFAAYDSNHTRLLGVYLTQLAKLWDTCSPDTKNMEKDND